MPPTVLVRYGTIAEVARFENAAGAALPRGERVIVESQRGLEIGTLLEEAPMPGDDGSAEPSPLRILRPATVEDDLAAGRLQSDCEQQFPAWVHRIADWKLRLDLIDLERTLDGSKLILYVLTGRGPECTRLALNAAAAGLGTVEVQPVGPEGLARLEPAGGCGSGCGSQGEGCCH
jgi:cell fate regulator YaaT (PSP1 superfamily)